MNGARLRSLDALRGFDMFWIMGLSGAVAGFCKLFPGGENSFLFHQMYHVEWEGLVKWSFPFQVVGANAIVAYMMQSLVNFRDPSRFLFGALAKLFPSPDFVIMSGYTLICWLILWYLYRKGTFLKV